MSSSSISPESTPVLRVDDLSAGYGSKPAIEKVDLTLGAGESVGLIGPNGAGKTTLIRSILGLVPVIRGSVEIMGRPVDEMRTSIAYVPQSEALDRQFPVSVSDVVLMGRYRRIGWFRRASKVDKSAALAALEIVGLADHSRVLFGKLSGGQRQRVLLARAIAQEARLLLLDEPFNGVDRESTDVLLSVLNEMRATGVALVMSTHDLAVAHLACDDACLLNRHQFAYGPVTSTLTPELLRTTYGGRAVALAEDSTLLPSPDGLSYDLSDESRT